MLLIENDLYFSQLSEREEEHPHISNSSLNLNYLYMFHNKKISIFSATFRISTAAQAAPEQMKQTGARTRGGMDRDRDRDFDVGRDRDRDRDRDKIEINRDK